MRPPLRTLIALLAVCGADTAMSQQKTPAPASSTPASSAAPAAAKAEPVNPSITIEQALYLIRSTLLALNDANHTGNYTVLRDLAAPDFQVKNTAADLALIFSDLRRRNFDLYGAALLAPQLHRRADARRQQALAAGRLFSDPAATDRLRPDL